MLLALLGIFVIVAVANVVVLVNEHGPSEPECAPGELCNNPPVTPVALGRVWTSPELGFSFEYRTDVLRVTSEDSRGVHFEITRDGNVQSDVRISGARAAEGSVDELVRQRRDVSPFWAGLTALLQQMVLADGQKELGFLNPTLYALARTNPPNTIFHDIVRGDNLYYPATPGWDFATGLGSPIASRLGDAIVAYLSANTTAA